jgi:hypothetical protein
VLFAVRDRVEHLCSAGVVGVNVLMSFDALGTPIAGACFLVGVLFVECDVGKGPPIDGREAMLLG